jgi:hypothetical protein
MSLLADAVKRITRERSNMIILQVILFLISTLGFDSTTITGANRQQVSQEKATSGGEHRDLSEFSGIQRCFNGAEVAIDRDSCMQFDCDHDGDIDLEDYRWFFDLKPCCSAVAADGHLLAYGAGGARAWNAVTKTWAESPGANYSLAAESEGNFIALRGTNPVFVWDSETSEWIEGPSNTITGLLGSAGRLLSFGPGGADVWDPSTKTWHQSLGMNYSMASESKGNFIVLRGDSPVFVWDKETLLWTQGPPGTVIGVLGSNGNLLAYGVGGARAWNAATKTWAESPGSNYLLAAESEGNFIALRGTNPVFVWDAETSEWTEGPSNTIDGLLGSAGRLLSFGPGGADVWDPTTKTWHQSLGLNYSMAAESNGNFIALRGDSPVFVWDKDTLRWTQGPPGTVFGVLGSNGHLLAYGAGGARAWNATTKTWAESPGANYSLAAESEGNFIALRGTNPVFVWDAETSEWTEGPSNTVTGLLGSAGRLLSFGPGGADVWDPITKTWYQAPGLNYSMASESNGNFIALRGDSPVFVWDKDTLLWTQGPPGTVIGVLGSNGNLLAYGAGGARAWNAVTKTWHEAPGANFNLATSAEGNFIVRRGDGPAFVWDSSTSLWEESPPGRIDGVLGASEVSPCQSD